MKKLDKKKIQGEILEGGLVVLVVVGFCIIVIGVFLVSCFIYYFLGKIIELVTRGKTTITEPSISYVATAIATSIKAIISANRGTSSPNKNQYELG